MRFWDLLPPMLLATIVQRVCKRSQCHTWCSLLAEAHDDRKRFMVLFDADIVSKTIIYIRRHLQLTSSVYPPFGVPSIPLEWARHQPTLLPCYLSSSPFPSLSLPSHPFPSTPHLPPPIPASLPLYLHVLLAQHSYAGRDVRRLRCIRFIPYRAGRRNGQRTRRRVRQGIGQVKSLPVPLF